MDKAKLFFSMFVFGTIGLFVRGIPLPSTVIALARGVIGVLFLLGVTLLRRQPLAFSALKRSLPVLCVSGLFLGFNWILLFEAYRYTTVSTATLCYYLAPVLMILVSPFLLKEALTPGKAVCVLAALGGMLCLSGLLESGVPAPGELTGILMGIAAAALYAAIVLMNKRMGEVPAFERTIAQLGISSLVLLPYCLFTGGFRSVSMPWEGWVLLIVVGVLHTGIAYSLYFSAIRTVRAQTVAVVSYLDPLVAVLASVLVLQEPMGGWEILGAVLILSAALCSEFLPAGKNKKERKTNA